MSIKTTKGYYEQVGDHINVSIYLDRLSPEQKRRVREINNDGLITDAEMMELMKMKMPHMFPKAQVIERIVERVVEVQAPAAVVRKLPLSPARRERIIFLAITSPSVIASLAMWLLG